MSYNTEFDGEFYLNKKLDNYLYNYLLDFNATRHMLYDVDKIKKEIPFWRYFSFKGDLGKEGIFVIDKDEIFHRTTKNKYVIDHNFPSNIIPDVWCSWKPGPDKQTIIWDGCTSDRQFTAWLNFLCNAFLEPEGYKLSGVVCYFGEDVGDCGYIIIDNNYVFNFADTVSPADLQHKFEHNQIIIDSLNEKKMTPEVFENYYLDRYDMSDDEIPFF